MARQARFVILMPDEMLVAIDEYRRSCPDLPFRTEAIRRLVQIGLASMPPRPARGGSELAPPSGTASEAP